MPLSSAVTDRRYSKNLCVRGVSQPEVSLPAANLLASGRRLLFAAVGEVRLHHRARVPDLLYYVPVLGLDGIVLVNDCYPPLTLASDGRGVVFAETRRSHDY
jgi:hypothetical protein